MIFEIEQLNSVPLALKPICTDLGELVSWCSLLSSLNARKFLLRQCWPVNTGKSAPLLLLRQCESYDLRHRGAINLCFVSWASHRFMRSWGNQLPPARSRCFLACFCRLEKLFGYWCIEVTLQYLSTLKCPTICYLGCEGAMILALSLKLRVDSCEAWETKVF